MRQPTLDVLRALLAWCVVVVHCVRLSQFTGQVQHVFGAVGVYAVIGFVTLSGYVITNLLLRRKERYAEFITRRFFRLFPCFIVCLAFAVALRPCTIGVDRVREASEHAYYPLHLLAHLTMLHGVIPDTVLASSSVAFLPPGWSVSLEWQLYLIAPFALALLVRHGRGVALLALTASAMLMLPPFSGYLSHFYTALGAFVPQRFFFFLVGMTIALYDVKICALPKRCPSSLVYLEQISYSTYLVHWPILVAFDALLRTSDLPSDLHAIILFSAGAPFILLASVLSYQFVELRGIELANDLIRRRRVRSNPRLSRFV
jgi:peptidoglycan/LPS O-acetylase OafA/YrhL